ncbi:MULTISPECIES: hypothetical protein [unclassified Shinella]|uniref:hypothetical protein n=1 Tax=unclassified Shinella TaxID=2643062 RepID=UPI000413BAB0|nr:MULTISPECIES: hypothetical protein [unclassified Shinella]
MLLSVMLLPFFKHGVVSSLAGDQNGGRVEQDCRQAAASSACKVKTVLAPERTIPSWDRQAACGTPQRSCFRLG